MPFFPLEWSLLGPSPLISKLLTMNCELVKKGLCFKRIIEDCYISKFHTSFLLESFGIFLMFAREVKVVVVGWFMTYNWIAEFLKKITPHCPLMQIGQWCLANLRKLASKADINKTDMKQNVAVVGFEKFIANVSILSLILEISSLIDISRILDQVKPITWIGCREDARRKKIFWYSLGFLSGFLYL